LNGLVFVTFLKRFLDAVVKLFCHFARLYKNTISAEFNV